MSRLLTARLALRLRHPSMPFRPLTPQLLPNPRKTTTTATPSPPPTAGILWFENLFPIKANCFDPRVAFSKRGDTSTIVSNLLPPSLDSAALKITKLEPSWKEGGMLVHFEGTEELGAAGVLAGVRKHLQEEGFVSWANLRPVKAHLVKGDPWVDDMVGLLPSTT
ncbi:hypothetical protein BDK51DRAFT_34542, partial [Blyttiomyces helicus]